MLSLTAELLSVQLEAALHDARMCWLRLHLTPSHRGPGKFTTGAAVAQVGAEKDASFSGEATLQELWPQVISKFQEVFYKFGNTATAIEIPVLLRPLQKQPAMQHAHSTPWLGRIGPCYKKLPNGTCENLHCEKAAVSNVFMVRLCFRAACSEAMDSLTQLLLAPA